MKERKKICFIVPRYEKNDATHFSYLVDFIEAVAQEVDIFLVIERGGRHIKKEWLLRGLYAIWFHFLPIRLVEFFFILIYVRIYGCRDFYVHYSFAGAFVGSIIARLTGARLYYWNCGEPWKYKRNIFREVFEKMVYHFISYLVTGTEGLKRSYARAYNIPESKIRVMPNWVSPEKFTIPEGKKEVLRQKLALSPDANILLFVHRLSERKGAHYLPTILERLSSENIIFLIVGDGPLRNLITDQLAKKGILKKTWMMLQDIPHDDIFSYYALADIFIMPSEEEGFPHSLLEAMAAGTPFVTFDVGGIREITPPELSRYIYPVGDVSGMVFGIQNLLSSEQEFLSVQNKEREWVRRFGKERAVKAFFELFV